MQNSRIVLFPALATIVAVILASPPAAAVPFLRIEGEDRDLNAPKCSSDLFDGETMMTVPFDGASGGQALFYPSNLCHAHYLVFLSKSSRLFLNVASGGGVGECMQWLVLLDGVFWGSTVEDCAPSELRYLEVRATLRIPPGLHAISVFSWYTDGPFYANSYVDFLEFE